MLFLKVFDFLRLSQRNKKVIKMLGKLFVLSVTLIKLGRLRGVNLKKSLKTSNYYRVKLIKHNIFS